MRVIGNSRDTKISFGSITPGECFVYENRLFMKCHKSVLGSYNAVSVIGANIVIFSDSANVTPQDTHVRYGRE